MVTIWLCVYIHVCVALPIIVGAQSMAVVHGSFSYAVIITYSRTTGTIYISVGVCTNCKYIFQVLLLLCNASTYISCLAL